MKDVTKIVDIGPFIADGWILHRYDYGGTYARTEHFQLKDIPEVIVIPVSEIDKIIEKYQSKADTFIELAKQYYGDGATVDRYKWSHSLASVYRSFVNELNELCGSLKGDD